jgi:type IV pilus assembly protein PilA
VDTKNKKGDNMKNNKAFTLVELLAVIAIMGVLLVIAVPQINKLIETSRIKTFESNEESLIDTAKNYMSGENENLPYEIGDSLEITYNDMKSAGYLDPIYDLVDNTECSTSKVTIIKTTEYNYEYVEDLICSTYNSESLGRTNEKNNALIITATKSHYNQIDLSSMVEGYKLSVNYETLKINTGILYDETTKSEVLSTTKGVIEKTSDGYNYYSGLVSDNYLNIETWNIVENHDFTEGTTGWSTTGASHSVSNNIMSFTGNGATLNPAIYASGSVNSIIGHQYYFSTKARVTNSNCESIRAYSGELTTLLTNPTINEWEKLSEVIVSTTDTFALHMYHYYSDAASGNGQTMEIDGNYGVYWIDLTEAFGAGNEPTKEEMDTMFTNNGY